MDREEIYEEIGEIANNADETITFEELADMLGLDHSRGIANRVKAAYHYFYRNNDSDTAENIADTFVDQDGEYAYLD